MQTDKVAVARAVRRRLADMKMADQLRSRGWSVSPPRDNIQAHVDLKAGLRS